jgi:hypothetical protein
MIHCHLRNSTSSGQLAARATHQGDYRERLDQFDPDECTPKSSAGGMNWQLTLVVWRR